MSQVLQDRQLLSNKALHLFLQTSFSMEVLLSSPNPIIPPQVIRDNLDGLRDDEILEQIKPGSTVETGDEQILNRIPNLLD